MGRWHERVETKATIFLKGLVDWTDVKYYQIGDVQLPRHIFQWPQSDRIFVLADGWMAESLIDALIIFPLSSSDGDEDYVQFRIPLGLVDELFVTHKTKFVFEEGIDTATGV